MRMPDALATMLREKLSKNIGYWAHEYEEAVERIEDHSADSENPYFHSDADNSDALPGVLMDEMGGYETPEDARRRGFELLALADLAEVLAAGSEPEGETA